MAVFFYAVLIWFAVRLSRSKILATKATRSRKSNGSKQPTQLRDRERRGLCQVHCVLFFSLLFYIFFHCPFYPLVLHFKKPNKKLRTIWIWMDALHWFGISNLVAVAVQIARNQEKKPTVRLRVRQQNCHEHKNSTEKNNDIIFIVIYLTFWNYRRSILTINLNINNTVCAIWIYILLLIFIYSSVQQKSAMHMKNALIYVYLYVISVFKNDS